MSVVKSRHVGPDLKEQVYHEIRDRIVHLKYPPGHPLSERDLAAEFGTSRGPIREAMARLRAQGLIDVVSRRGAYVTHVDLSRFRDGMEVKIELEGMAARLATPHFTEDELEALQNLLDEIGEGGEVLPAEKVVAIDQRIHRKVWAKSGNSYLTELLEGINNQIARVWRVYLRDTGTTMGSSVRNLGCVLEAFRRGDALAAEEAMRRHVHDFLDDVIRDVFSLDRQ